jgi:hypothetical protein
MDVATSRPVLEWLRSIRSGALAVRLSLLVWLFAYTNDLTRRNRIHIQTDRASYTLSKKVLFAPSVLYSEILFVDGMEQLKLLIQASPLLEMSRLD